MSVQIKGGYYIKARCIQNSEISTAPPYVREIWDWVLKECNHKESKSSGKIIHRGECVRTFKDIQEGLKWMVGYRTEKYKKWQCENSMKWLTRVGMIATTKTTRGMVIKVLNYDKYQDPKNYESNNESNNEATMKQQLTDTINKNDKNEKKEISKPKVLLDTNKLNEIIDTFYKETKNRSLFSNKTQRKALEDLIKDTSRKKVIDMIEFAFKNKDKEFCPQISTPIELQYKWSKLETFKNNLIPIEKPREVWSLEKQLNGDYK